MSDLISRQDAIDAIYEHEFPNWCDKDEVSTILNDLPSVEPTEIIRCKDCKHYNKFIATLSKTGQAVWDEYCEKFRRSVTADDFCSRAERRTE